MIYHYHIWKVLPRDHLIQKRFLFYLLKWDVDRIKQAHGTGTTMMHVSKGSMDNRSIPITTMANQSQIVASLDSLQMEVTRLESIYEQKLAALEELKRSLLDQAFRGEL